MEIRVIHVTKDMKCLQLGRLGENETMQFVFDVSDWLERYPGCTIGLVNRLPKAEEGYPCVVESLEDGKVGWTITSAELTVKGKGDCELQAVVNGKVEKGKFYNTEVLDAIDGSGTAPEPWQSFVTQVLEAAEDAEDSAEDAEAWAVGKRGGVDVGDTDPTYHNSAKYHAEQAAGSATAAGTAEGNAEAWATGGSSGTPSATNNAKYYSEQAAGSASSAEDAKDAAEDAQEAIENLGVSASTLTPGSSATVTKTVDPQTGEVTLTFGIPEGEKGDTGDTGYPTQAQVTQAVDDYLEENFTNPSNPPLDRSLSSSSSAAPADMVGDLNGAISEMTDATYDDTNKVLRAKTVSNGKVTEWDFADYPLSVAQQSALFNCFRHVAWIDENGQDYYDALYDAFNSLTWEVTNTLTGCISSNGARKVDKDSAYSATILPADGYTLTGATVLIMMGDLDISSAAYSNGVISIASVTAPLTITITAVAKTISSLGAVYTQSGYIYADTTDLDDLKLDLVVTAYYTDQTSSVIASANYTLSGTLAAGTSAITVTFEEETTTFNVTVSSPLYSLPSVSETTVSDSGGRTAKVSITNGVVSGSGTISGVIYISSQGQVTNGTSRPTTQWFTIPQNADILLEMFDISWAAEPNYAVTYQCKFSQSNVTGNVIGARFEVSANTSGTGGHAERELDEHDAYSISGIALQMEKTAYGTGTSCVSSYSFKMRLTVNGVRYF